MHFNQAIVMRQQSERHKSDEGTEKSKIFQNCMHIWLVYETDSFILFTLEGTFKSNLEIIFP